MIEFIRKKLQAHKEFRYLISGASSEIIEYISFWVLLSITQALYISNSISFILGIASAFLFHKLWSFAGNQQFKTHSQIVAYCLLAFFNFIMINVIVGLLVQGLQVHPYVAKIISMVMTALWSYVVFNFYIFKHNKPSQ